MISHETDQPVDQPSGHESPEAPNGDTGAAILEQLFARVGELHSRLDEDHARRSEVVGELQRMRSELIERRTRQDSEALARNQRALAAIEQEVANLRGISAELRRQIEDERGALRAGLESERKAGLEEIDRQREEGRAELARERQRARAELERELAEVRRKVEEEIAEGARQRLQARFELERQLEQMRRDAEAAIAADRARVRQEAQALEDEREAFRREQAELNTRKQEVDDLRDALESDRLRLDRKVEQMAGDRLRELDDRLSLANQTAERVARERDDLEKKLRERQELDRRFGDQTPEAILARIRALQEKASRLEKELDERPGPEHVEKYNGVTAERDRLAVENEQLRYAVRKLETELRAATINVAELEGIRQQREHAETHLKLLQARHDQLRKDVEQFQKLSEKSPERDARIGVVEEKVHDLTRAQRNPSTNESEWLDTIEEGFTASRFKFPRRLLNAFHASLKISDWNSLTVLAGVSGTGKSELPRLYSMFGGIVFEPVAIQPNWDSPQDLFGFFNYMDNKFNARPLLQAIAQSQRAPVDREGFNDRLLLVLLDEMNLARVELYFSELLSKLELRRGEARGVSIEVDLGSGLPKHRVPLGRNLLFVGTMNEDETTHALSDKALDRSNVITFPSPRLLSSRDELRLAPANGLLPYEVWESWQRKPSSIDDAVRNGFRESVERINAGLAGVGRALGHRVWQAIENYIANHPEVCAATGDGDRLERAQRLAFEDQLVQKIMPKLRGVETEGRAGRACLDAVGEVLREKAPGLSADFQEARDLGQGSFLWRSAHYLETEA